MALLRLMVLAPRCTLEYSLDANQQKRNEEAVAATLTKLAATGKLIRISDLNITVVQANGIEVSERK